MLSAPTTASYRTHALSSGQDPQRSLSYQPQLFKFKRHDSLHFRDNGLWRIQSGYVRTLTWNAEGEFTPLGFWQTGDVIGCAIAQANPYKAQCLTPVVAEYLGSHYAFSKCDVLAQVRQSNELLQISHCRNADMRLLSFLCWAAQRFGKPSTIERPLSASQQNGAQTDGAQTDGAHLEGCLSNGCASDGCLSNGCQMENAPVNGASIKCYRRLLRLTHQEIGESIGITRVTVTRLLKGLEQDGLIQWNKQEKIVFQKAFQHCCDNIADSRSP
ncbi:MAG: Crp/Fnr family transcriptional regulator [Phormidesmis sp.]